MVSGNEYLFFELASEFDIFEVHHVLLGDMGIQVLLIGLEVVKTGINEFAFVIVVLHSSSYTNPIECQNWAKGIWVGWR